MSIVSKMSREKRGLWAILSGERGRVVLLLDCKVVFELQSIELILLSSVGYHKSNLSSHILSFTCVKRRDCTCHVDRECMNTPTAANKSQL